MNNYGIRCTLCNSEKINPIHNKIRNIADNSSKMYECDSCGTHFLFPQPQEDQLEAYYDGEFREDADSSAYYNKLDSIFQSFTPEAKNRVNRLADQLDPEDELLEIGCSIGYFLKAAVDKVKSAYGTEWDSRARSYINDIIADPRIKANKNPTDFHMKFDKIFLFHVLEHISNPIDFLIQLKPLLKHGGKIYIEVPNVDDIMIKTFQYDIYKDFYYQKAHLYNFNEKGLQYIFEKSGFTSNISYIQRYDISNHFYWLVNKTPGGSGHYKSILSDQLNNEYAKSLIQAKQSDTLFATIQQH